ncbi:MAG: arginine--tRNA ligase, partial [Dehalococcoidales bacterium]
MLKQRLAKLLTQAIAEAQRAGKLPSVTLPEMIIERPQNPEHGDYASSLPLKLARATRANPLAIAGEIIDFIGASPEIGRVQAAPPGFINFTLKDDWLSRQVGSILESRDVYGTLDLGADKRVQIEFVSVNPTGPLHVGHGRGAVLGSALASVLTAAGYKVEKEYYINDAGNQIDVFNRSLYARYQQCLGIDAEMPADGYHGDYMVDLAKEIIAEDGERFQNLPESEFVSELRRVGVAKMTSQIKADLELLEV